MLPLGSLGVLLELFGVLLEPAVPCRFAVFCCRALLKTRFVQDCTSNCKLHLILVLLGLSRASLGASCGTEWQADLHTFCYCKALLGTCFAQDTALNGLAVWAGLAWVGFGWRVVGNMPVSSWTSCMQLGSEKCVIRRRGSRSMEQ